MAIPWPRVSRLFPAQGNWTFQMFSAIWNLCTMLKVHIMNVSTKSSAENFALPLTFSPGSNYDWRSTGERKSTKNLKISIIGERAEVPGGADHGASPFANFSSNESDIQSNDQNAIICWFFMYFMKKAQSLTALRAVKRSLVIFQMNKWTRY